MRMPPYPVLCYGPKCVSPALYKVAAHWSDGVTGELKTYSLACEQCLPNLFGEAKIKRDACRLTEGESLGEPRIFLLAHGERDHHLQPCGEIEANMGPSQPPPKK
jgi:hypothetical protein